MPFPEIFRKQAEEAFRKRGRQPEKTNIHASGTAANASDFDFSRFLASLRHEIRTPLNAILGFSQLMQDDPELSVLQQQRAGIINQSGEQLLAILNGILELSAISAGLHRLYPANFDLPALLDDLSAAFRQKAEARNLTLETEGLDRLPHCIFADEEKLRRMLYKLLDHSVRVTKTGSVRLRAWAESSEQNGSDGVNLLIRVECGWTGIEAGDIDSWFNASGQTAPGSGCGMNLELAVSRQLARLMGGDVCAAGKDGTRCVFRIEIPVKAGTDATAANKADDACSPARSAVERTGRASSLTREMLSEIPEALKTRIREAVVRGRQEQVFNLIQQVAVLDAHAGGKLRDLAAAFDYDTLLQLLE